MSSRRAFLAASAGAPLFGAERPRGERAKLYTILFDIAPSRDDTSLPPQSCTVARRSATGGKGSRT